MSSTPAEEKIEAAERLGRIGVEIELLAPAGRSRLDLAMAIAERHGGGVTRFFHPQGEPSKAPNTPFFENLTLGFLVHKEDGQVIAKCVDDLTLQDDLDPKAPPKPGWYRIVSDDARLLRLGMRYMDANLPLEQVLQPMAEIFESTVESGEAGMVRVADEVDEPIVLGARLPGERERPCELVTPPMDANHFAQLESFLEPARELGFTIPSEGAIHLHFDATELCEASTISNLIRFLGLHVDFLRERFATNPRCRRLGMWPAALFDLVASPEFVAMDWDSARTAMAELKPIKYCDFNICNLINATPAKHTFEVRILPVWLEAEKIIEAAVVFRKIIDWSKENPGKIKRIPEDPSEVIGTNE